MKSTVLKKKDYTLIKKYAAIYAVLFVIAIVLFTDHFFEVPFTVDELQTDSHSQEEKSEVGFLAPNFTVRNLKGNRVSLDQFRGQVVILNLWATWCGPCRVEMPGFETMYRRFRSEGLTILAVSLDKGDTQKVKNFVEQYRLSFPVLMDDGQVVERLYPTFTIPTTYVIDKQGRVAAKVDGAKNWQSEQTFEALEYLLNAK